MTTPRLLVCGAGNMGRNHLRVLSTLSELCEIAGAVEPRSEVADKLKIPRVFADPREALDALEPDAIIIATPTATHLDLCELALQRGIPFLVEKPVAVDVGAGRELAERTRAQKLPAMVGQIERFNPAVVAVRRLVGDGQLGEIVNISARRVGGTPQDAHKAGDVLVDLAVHDLDIARWLAGELRFEAATGHHRMIDDRPLIDSATILCSAGETTVDVHVNWATPVKVRSLTVTGTEGHIDANLITQQVTFTRKNPVLASGQATGDGFFDDYLLSFATPDSIQIGILKREPLREELRAFVEALGASDPERAMPVPLEEGVAALALADTARRHLAESSLARGF
jgi:predicted dehydrogenase